MDDETAVTLNGVELYEGIDYRWTSTGRLVLKRPRPKFAFPSFLDNVVSLLLLRWASIGNPECTYPDFVMVENWEYGSRSTYMFDTKEFDAFISYE